MKKALALFIASFAALSLSIFSACSSEGDVSLPADSSSEKSISSEIESVSSEKSSSSEIESVSSEVSNSAEIDSILQKTTAFYNLVSSSKKLLDIVAEDVYSYWYSSIYDDGAYENDIDVAILAALNDNSETIAEIDKNDVTIQSLYKEIRDSELSTEIKAVMSIYLDYYEFAINVSGSFKDYKEAIDPLQKEFEDALKALLLEM